MRSASLLALAQDEARRLLTAAPSTYRAHHLDLASDYGLHLVVCTAPGKPVLLGHGDSLAFAMVTSKIGPVGVDWSTTARFVGDTLQELDVDKPGSILTPDEEPWTLTQLGFDAWRRAQHLNPYRWYVGPRHRGDREPAHFNLGWIDHSGTSPRRLGEAANNREAVLDLLIDFYRMNGYAFADYLLLHRILRDYTRSNP